MCIRMSAYNRASACLKWSTEVLSVHMHTYTTHTHTHTGSTLTDKHQLRLKPQKWMPHSSCCHTHTHMQSSTSRSTASFDVVLRSLMALQRQMVSREPSNMWMRHTGCISARVKHVYVDHCGLVNVFIQLNLTTAAVFIVNISTDQLNEPTLRATIWICLFSLSVPLCTISPPLLSWFPSFLIVCIFLSPSPFSALSFGVC